MQPERHQTPPRRRVTVWDPFALTVSDEEHQRHTNQLVRRVLVTSRYEVNEAEEVGEIEIHGDPSVVSSEDEDDLLNGNSDDHNLHNSEVFHNIGPQGEQMAL
jgi:hypothetical protein